MKRIAATFAVVTIAGVLALATPALAYDGMDEEMHAELVALGLEEKTIALFEARKAAAFYAGTPTAGWSGSTPPPETFPMARKARN
jgi:hypothetical protein